MKLGDAVSFTRYYRKGNDCVIPDFLTKDQLTELEETDLITLQRLDVMELDAPLTGIIAGKRRMTEKIRFGFGQSRYNPDGEEVFGQYDSQQVKVYLVAVNLTGFYRVPEEWLEYQLSI